MMLPYSVRLTTPLTISPTRSLNSSYCRLRSYSRTRWTITCLAVCAAMRPKSIGGSWSTRKSPTLDFGLELARDLDRDLGVLVLDRFGHLRPARQPHLAGLAVDVGADVVLVAVLGAAGLLDGLLHRLEHFLALDRLLARDRVGHQQQFGAGDGSVHGVLSTFAISWAASGGRRRSGRQSTRAWPAMSAGAVRPRCRLEPQPRGCRRRRARCR